MTPTEVAGIMLEVTETWWTFPRVPVDAFKTWLADLGEFPLSLVQQALTEYRRSGGGADYPPGCQKLRARAQALQRTASEPAADPEPARRPRPLAELEAIKARALASYQADRAADDDVAAPAAPPRPPRPRSDGLRIPLRHALGDRGGVPGRHRGPPV
jgi:hypothetical protein